MIITYITIFNSKKTAHVQKTARSLFTAIRTVQREKQKMSYQAELTGSGNCRSISR